MRRNFDRQVDFYQTETQLVGDDEGRAKWLQMRANINKCLEWAAMGNATAVNIVLDRSIDLVIRPLAPIEFVVDGSKRGVTEEEFRVVEASIVIIKDGQPTEGIMKANSGLTRGGEVRDYYFNPLAHDIRAERSRTVTDTKPWQTGISARSQGELLEFVLY